ncbi:DNA repair protein rhp57 [Microsporum canis]|uniref:DNA repair protein RAD57 n=1 Tax=Arthroderma otae (strain ATCC MYA-4605 / CBS 113480) TaxID=554155 RepID=C5FEM4_ARTOC|nr:DNA repair protein RAD57 [Microsporum canis CBS 113480]EEQ28348.1 DNA repair protein RAD57 [Microsporum canis CBS 113480]
MDLSLTLPSFPIKQYAHILPLLEKAGISVKELLLFDALEVAKASRAPVTDIRHLTTHVLEALRQDFGLGAGSQKDKNNEACQVTSGRDDNSSASRERDHLLVAEDETFRVPRPPLLRRISTLDPILDSALAGGISTGYLTEVTGESGAGKTQFLLHLLLSVQLPAPHGLSKNALYISTESDLATNRLSQLLNEHTVLQSLHPDIPRPSLDNVFSVTTVDLETQEHIINYQVPVAISRFDIGLVVIDSITANYRAESSTESVSGLLERSWQLKKLGHFLRALAVRHSIAIVVANQISDGFESTLNDSFPEELRDDSASPLENLSPTATSSFILASQPYQQPKAVGNKLVQGCNSPQVEQGFHDDEEIHTCKIQDFNTLLSLEYQQPFFTGWGQAPHSYLRDGSFGVPRGLKLPALGLIWTNQIGCRIVLKSKSVFQPQDINGLTLISQNSNSNTQNSNKKISNNVKDFGENDATIHNDRSSPGHDKSAETRRTTESDSTLQSQSSQFSQESFDTLGDEIRSEYTSIPTTHHRGRLRQMQVVFSSWTSGNPKRSTQYDDEDSKNHHEQCGISKEAIFDPMYDSVEFEILPQGLRGLDNNKAHPNSL